MTSAVKLHPYMYKLLIEMNFNDFSSVHLRDALQTAADDAFHIVETRKFIRRQILRLERLGFIRNIGNGNGKSEERYKKTDDFYSTKFIPGRIPKNSCLKAVLEESNSSVSVVDDFVNDISNEKVINEAKLAVVLSEIEEYQSLMQRFPSRKKELMHLCRQAKNQSAALLGKVTALSKALGKNTDGYSSC